MENAFEFLNNFFDKIFVITLKRAVDRHRHIKKELHGLNYEFYFGEDKNEHTIQELEKNEIYSEKKANHFHRYDKPMSLGHICCSWSHLHLYQKIIHDNINKALIFEDDVVVIKENLSQISHVLSQLPTAWELLYLGWEQHEKKHIGLKLKQQVYHVQRIIGFHKWNRNQINNLYPKNYSRNLKKAGFHDCTHAYAITLSAAKKLLKLQTPIAFNADSLLSYATTNQLIEAYIATPKIFNQFSQYSLHKMHSFVTE